MKYEYWLASLMSINSRKRIQARMLCDSARELYEKSEKSLQKMLLSP